MRFEYLKSTVEIKSFFDLNKYLYVNTPFILLWMPKYGNISDWQLSHVKEVNM